MPSGPVAKIVQSLKEEGTFDALRLQLYEDFLVSREGRRFVRELDDFIEKSRKDLNSADLSNRSELENTLMQEFMRYRLSFNVYMDQSLSHIAPNHTKRYPT